MNIPVENRTELAVISTVKMVENDLSDTCELKTYFTYLLCTIDHTSSEAHGWHLRYGQLLRC